MSFNSKMPNAADFFQSDGKGFSSAGVRYLADLEKMATRLNSLGKPDAITDGIPWGIQYPDAATYNIAIDWPFAAKIVKVSAVCAVGSVTANLKIDETSISGADAISITTTQGSVTPTGNNDLTAGKTLSIALSDVDNCEGVSLMLRYTRGVS